MLFERSAGILLHPTSLANNEGIGTLGKSAYTFIDWLSSAHIRIWQVLPLGPTGYGDSPYAAFSSFAGNPLLIDLEMLAAAGLLSEEAITLPDYLCAKGAVDFGSVVYWKLPLLKKAAARFLSSAYRKTHNEPDSNFAAYKAFCKAHPHLNEYALFMSIKEVYDKKAQEEQLSGKLWNNYWPKDLAKCEPAAIKRWKTGHKTEIEIQKVMQFFFFSQWNKLKAYAHQNNISIIGDIPIFVAPDSADVWANQSLFQLDSQGIPLVVAGVPPDYFSAQGQLWGNPLYDWDKMKASKYRWWLDRIDSCLELVDYIRIDHFRGFEAYWAIPFGSKTAEHGTWQPCPGMDFFKAVKKHLVRKDKRYEKELPIIAEDLGVITQEVEQLRDAFYLPGMKVLQFAFSAAEVREKGFTNAFLPHTYHKHSVVYTGTHDNTTLRAWIESLSKEDLAVLLLYLNGESPSPAFLDNFVVDSTHEEADSVKAQLCKQLIKQALFSVAALAIIPFQDIHALGKEARMNIPSTLGNNWTWRMNTNMLGAQAAAWLKDLVTASSRT